MPTSGRFPQHLQAPRRCHDAGAGAGCYCATLSPGLFPLIPLDVSNPQGQRKGQDGKSRVCWPRGVSASSGLNPLFEKQGLAGAVGETVARLRRKFRSEGNVINSLYR